MSTPNDPNLSSPLCGGRYELQHALGEGSTATVYAALDRETGEPCAVKILSPAFALHRDARARFEREASTMARLRHPHIVAVMDYGLDAERFYIVMERVQGGTLMEVVDQGGPLKPRLAASIMQRTMYAMHHAHVQGVIHRDVKPHNILMAPGSVPKVTDFGLARAMHFSQKLTIPGAVMGTWAYMAPEQRYDSGNVDIRTDIYAAGATLYAVLTGREPHELLRPPPDKDLFAAIEPSLAGVIQRATKFKPEERYQSAEEMAIDLERVHAGLPSESPDDGALLLEHEHEESVPMPLQQFDHLDEIKDELIGPRRGRKRASRGGEAPAAAPEPAKKPRSGLAGMSWPTLLLLGLGAGGAVGAMLLAVAFVAWRLLAT